MARSQWALALCFALLGAGGRAHAYGPSRHLKQAGVVLTDLCVAKQTREDGGVQCLASFLNVEFTDTTDAFCQALASSGEVCAATSVDGLQACGFADPQGGCFFYYLTQGDTGAESLCTQLEETYALCSDDEQTRLFDAYQAKVDAGATGDCPSCTDDTCLADFTWSGTGQVFCAVSLPSVGTDATDAQCLRAAAVSNLCDAAPGATICGYKRADGGCYVTLEKSGDVACSSTRASCDIAEVTLIEDALNAVADGDRQCAVCPGTPPPPAPATPPSAVQDVCVARQIRDDGVAQCLVSVFDTGATDTDDALCQAVAINSDVCSTEDFNDVRICGFADPQGGCFFYVLSAVEESTESLAAECEQLTAVYDLCADSEVERLFNAYQAKVDAGATANCPSCSESTCIATLTDLRDDKDFCAVDLPGVVGNDASFDCLVWAKFVSGFCESNPGATVCAVVPGDGGCIVTLERSTDVQCTSARPVCSEEIQSRIIGELESVPAGEENCAVCPGGSPPPTSPPAPTTPPSPPVVRDVCVARQTRDDGVAQCLVSVLDTGATDTDDASCEALALSSEACAASNIEGLRSCGFADPLGGCFFYYLSAGEETAEELDAACEELTAVYDLCSDAEAERLFQAYQAKVDAGATANCPACSVDTCLATLEDLRDGLDFCAVDLPGVLGTETSSDCLTWASFVSGFCESVPGGTICAHAPPDGGCIVTLEQSGNVQCSSTRPACNDEQRTRIIDELNSVPAGEEVCAVCPGPPTSPSPPAPRTCLAKADSGSCFISVPTLPEDTDEGCAAAANATDACLDPDFQGSAFCSYADPNGGCYYVSVSDDTDEATIYCELDLPACSPQEATRINDDWLGREDTECVNTCPPQSSPPPPATPCLAKVSDGNCFISIPGVDADTDDECATAAQANDAVCLDPQEGLKFCSYADPEGGCYYASFSDGSSTSNQFCNIDIAACSADEAERIKNDYLERDDQECVRECSPNGKPQSPKPPHSPHLPKSPNNNDKSPHNQPSPRPASPPPNIPCNGPGNVELYKHCGTDKAGSFGGCKAGTVCAVGTTAGGWWSMCLPKNECQGGYDCNRDECGNPVNNGRRLYGVVPLTS